MIFKQKIIIAVVLGTTTALCYGFNTLKDLQTFVSTNPELVKNQSQNILSPTFHSSYYSQKSTLFSKFLRKIGLGSMALWQPSDFVTQLERTIKSQQNPSDKPKIAYLKVAPGSEIYVWGSLYGNIHSLSFSLSWLQSQNLISNDFTLTSTNTYLVFLGDMIGRSAYSLQFLTVMLTLLEKNPNQIIYLQGNTEQLGHWQDFDIRKQLQIIFETRTKVEVPYGNLLQQFFNNLPISLYITSPGNQNELIAFYSENQKLRTLDESYYWSFFTSKNTLGSVQYHDIDKKDDTPENKLILKTIVKNDNAITGKKEIDGLAILEQIKGALTFGIISTPVIKDQQYAYFFYNTFVKIDIKEPLQKSTIALFNHPAQEQNSEFTQAKILNIETGLAPSVPLKSDIVVGSTMSLEYGIPWHGRYTRMGLLARINEVNLSGGIDGHLVKAFI